MINIPKEMIIVFAMIFGLYLLVLLAIISDLVSGVRKAKQRDEETSNRLFDYGSRLAFRGSLVEAENVSAFKAIEINN